MSGYVPVRMRCTCCVVEKVPTCGRGKLVMIRVNGREYRGFEAAGRLAGITAKTVMSRMHEGTCLQQPVRVMKRRAPEFPLGDFSLRFQRVMAASFR